MSAPENLPPASPEDLSCCASCNQYFIQIVARREISEGWFGVVLECQNCDELTGGEYSADALEKLLFDIEEEQLAIMREADELRDSRINDEVESFSRTLEQPRPEDF